MRTRDLTARMTVDSVDGVSSDAVVQLSDDDGPLLLESLDEIQVFIPGWLLDMIQDRQEQQYYAQIPDAPDAALYTFAILREHAEGAPKSEVVLPVAPVLTAPAALSRGTDDLVLSWPADPEGPPTVLTIEGDCIDGLDEELEPEIDSWTGPAGTLGGEGSCDLTVTATRTAVGELDPLLAGGEITARQRRSAVVSSTP